MQLRTGDTIKGPASYFLRVHMVHISNTSFFDVFKDAPFAVILSCVPKLLLKSDIINIFNHFGIVRIRSSPTFHENGRVIRFSHSNKYLFMVTRILKKGINFSLF